MTPTVSPYRKKIAIMLLCLFSVHLTVPTAYGLTSGPSQPEVQSFQPASAADMVDLFTGDFNYNIPLFELPGPNGGYPFNLSYQSGIGMDQEASWVGLGFNLNPGAVSRQMRGLPDEFKGDQVYTKMSIKPSVTVGLGAGVGNEIFGGAGQLGLGLSVSQNNYQGFSYSIDGSVGYEKAVGNSMTGGVGLDLSLNPKEGIGVNPSLTLGTKFGDFGLGAGYNSKAGLYNMAFTHDFQVEGKLPKMNEEDPSERANNANVTSTLSLAAQGYTPQVTMPMRSTNIALTFKAGAAWWAVDAHGYVRGFYNEQRLKNDRKRVPSSAFGYMNYQYATGNRPLLDFNREKDGIVSKETPNLGIPSLTYDIYSATGQGFSAMYRPMRNDYGTVHDPETVSKSTGGSIGVDASPGLTHVGFNRNVNHSESRSGLWNSQTASSATFTTSLANSIYEPWYFKVHGEPVGESINPLNRLGGDAAVRVKLSGTNRSPEASAQLENRSWNGAIPSPELAKRKPRSQVIQSITNDELVDPASQELNSLFKTRYLDHNGVIRDLDRSGNQGHHLAGMTALTPSGLRYTYAIPAYNLYQEEVTFSASKQAGQAARVNVGNGGSGDPYFEYRHTDKYLKRVEMPAYAYSYLLTSVVGSDYVDVTGDGVTEDDLGYWVKFTYQKATPGNAPYQWRDPYSQAHYVKGWETDPRDDKGSFVYGQKEIWYLTQAETKSHIAKFTLQDRQDGRGVASKLQDSNNHGSSLKALRQIELFTRAANGNFPIKTVKFEYDYSLCPGVFNNALGSGKLTLKKLWFEYGNTTRGRLNPYEFSYATNNPSYDLYAYDRWGNYKPYPPSNVERNKDFPYALQDPSMKEAIDRYAASWSLGKIKMPSGSELIIDYETDDYAYVQHLPAMQMTTLVDPYSAAATLDPTRDFLLNDADTKIRFKLESPLPGDVDPGQEAVVKRYLDLKRKQLYFKAKINLRSVGEGFDEFISGYADIDLSKPMGLEKDASGNYVYGYFHLKKEEGHHPFSLRAWQHIRTNQPDLANSGRRLNQTDDPGSRAKQIKSLGSIFGQIRQMFEGFYNYCSSKNWGRQVIAENAWIKLNSPDKVKYGGGLRVRQITLKDQWQYDKDGIYGQLYEYTTEENGETISSGVAAYEPFIGGDENPLRYAKRYSQSIPLRADNNLFFEYPINESYYPGPQVGYSRVAVSSLAAAYQAGKEVNHIDVGNGELIFPTGEPSSFSTTGRTVHEFFTARDFPVITDETEKDDKPYKLSVLVPFLGSISINKLASSQGYSVVTNDMHGKTKKVSNYRQSTMGEFEEEPISWIKYNYLGNPRIYDEEKINVVSNLFTQNEDGTFGVASSADLSNPAVEKFTLGQEQEFFTDLRQFEDKTWGGGLRGNVDILHIPILFAIVPIPVFTGWPNVSKTARELRSAATNKVVFKKGILESIEAYDGGSLLKTRHIKWDKLTGEPLLTTVNNNFDQPVYQYNIPAYTQYEGMGAAFENVGVKLTMEDLTALEDNRYSFATTLAGALFPGDELLLYPVTGNFVEPVTRATYLGNFDESPTLYADKPLTSDAYEAMIIRSGRRNQLYVSAGQLSALEDPSQPGNRKHYNKTLIIPNE